MKAFKSISSVDGARAASIEGRTYICLRDLCDGIYPPKCNQRSLNSVALQRLFNKTYSYLTRRIPGYYSREGVTGHFIPVHSRDVFDRFAANLEGSNKKASAKIATTAVKVLPAVLDPTMEQLGKITLMTRETSEGVETINHVLRGVLLRDEMTEKRFSNLDQKLDVVLTRMSQAAVREEQTSPFANNMRAFFAGVKKAFAA